MCVFRPGRKCAWRGWVLKNSPTPKKIVLILKTQRFPIWVIGTLWDSESTILFIEVIAGTYHTNILHTKHLRHKEIEVSFSFIHIESRILGDLLGHLWKTESCHIPWIQIKQSDWVGWGHTESRTHSSLCLYPNSWSCYIHDKIIQWVVSQTKQTPDSPSQHGRCEGKVNFKQSCNYIATFPCLPAPRDALPQTIHRYS